MEIAGPIRVKQQQIVGSEHCPGAGRKCGEGLHFNCRGADFGAGVQRGDAPGSLPLTAMLLCVLSHWASPVSVTTSVMTGPPEIRWQQPVPSTLSSFSELPCCGETSCVV